MAITITGSKYGLLTLASAGTTTATITGTNFVSGDFASTRLIALLDPDGTERLTNGGFATDTDWTKGTGVTISGGVVNSTNGAFIISQSSPSFTAGKFYRVSIGYTQTAGAKLRFGTGTSDGANIVYTTGTIANGSGTITFYFRASSTTTGFYVGADTSNWSGTLDNFSIAQVGDFKGMAWARRYVSTSQIQLQSEFFHPITGAAVTQVTGDVIQVSKNFAESVVTGLTVTNKVVACTTATSLTFGTDNNPRGVCFYDENKEIQNAVTTLFSGGVAVFGKLENFADGILSSPCDWYLSGASFNNGIRTSNLAAVACMYGGTIDGNRANTYYIGGNITTTGGGVGGTILLIQKVQNVFDFASPSAGATWGANAANHVLRDCTSITNALYAIMVRWGDGVVSGGTYKFPNNTASPLSVFGSDVAGTITISAPPGKRLTILDPGASAISGNYPQLVRSDTAVAITANFTNLVSSIYGFTISATGAANSNGVNNFYFSDSYTNVQSGSVGVVTLDADSSVVDSTASSSTTWSPSVYRRKWTGLTENFVRGPWSYGIKKYGYNPVSGAIASSNYPIDGGYTADNVAFGGAVNQIADTKITLSQSAANALSAIADYCELYDAIINWGVLSVTNAQYPSLSTYPASASGTLVDIGSRNLVLNNAAGTALAINTGTHIITAKATGLATCASFSSIKTTGYITASLTTGGAYTYTNGTIVGGTLVPTFTGGTLDIGAAGSYTFSSTGILIVKPTPTAPGTYTISGTHTGTLDLRNQAAHAITVNLPAGTTYTTANNTGGTITVVLPTVDLTVTSTQAGSTLQVFTTTTQTLLASGTGASLVYPHSNETVDIVVQKAGYLPQREVGVVLSGTMTKAYTLVVDNNYDAAHGLTYTTSASWSRANNQLTVPTFGPSVRGVYSLMIDSFIAQSTLRNTAFNLTMNGPTSLFLTNGAEGATDASITNMTGGGVRFVSTAGATTAEFGGVLSSGVVAGSQPEYELGAGGTIADARATGNVNEIIKVYGDATHGNFDKRDRLQYKVQRNGYREAFVDVVASFGSIGPTLYVISLPMIAIDGLTLGDPGATGLTITDYSASPFAFDVGDGSKNYSIVINDTGNNPGNTILRWTNYNGAQDATFQGFEPFYLPEMILDNGAALETLVGILHNNPDVPVGVLVLRNGMTPHPDFTRFQSDDGTYGTPPAQGTITISGAVAGSRVLVRNDTTNTVISNAVGTGYSDTYVEGTDFTTGDTIEVTVTHVDKLEQVYTGVISSSGYTLVIDQEDDEVYIAKGFDGSTFTGITFNTTTIDLDLDGSEDPVVLWGETYARYKYSITTETGIETLIGAMFAKDAANYLFSNAVVINNLNATPVIIGGDGYANRRDGGTMFGTGNIQIDNSIGVLIVETGVSGLTASESEQLMGLPSAPTIADAVWDEPLTGATHNLPTSAGRRLRQINAPIIWEGTAQGPGTGTNQIQLDTGASSTNGAYDPAIVSIVGGTGAGQSRIILQYVGATRTATVHRGWRVAPNATSEFIIQSHADIVSVNEGLAQAGGANTITLNADASSVDGTYIGQLVFIVSGTGEDQCGMVCAYNGATKVATVEVGHGGGWATVPDSTSAYVMMPASPILLAACDLSAQKIGGLTFTVPGVVDSNIQYVNDAEVKGTGNDGDTWGPA